MAANPPRRREGEEEIARLSAALLPGVREQFQNRADADPLRSDLRADLDRFRRRRDADSGMALSGQRNGRDPGPRRGWAALHPNGAASAPARGALWPFRRSRRE